MKVPHIKSCYTQDDFDLLGFHDCYIYGIRWSVDDFSLMLDLDYIVKWVEKGSSYQFWISPAKLCFKNVAETNITIDWTIWAPECQIEDFWKRDSRTTPNGMTEHHWEIDLAIPIGSISLWATNFDLIIQAAPKLLKKQQLGRSGFLEE